MATGMHTGVRTGSTPMPTGRAPQGGGSGYGNILQKLSKMSPKTKMIIYIAVGVLLVAGIIFGTVSSSNKLVPLYSSPLTPTDCQEIANRLNEWNIPHEVQEGGTAILISFAYKARSQMQLSSFGLPHRPVGPKSASEGGLDPKTKEDKERMWQQELEGELIEAIRQISGVADAYIKIVQPKESIFKEDQKPATAMVMLRLQPGAKMMKNQIDGIVHLVAFSVSGLEAENVKVLDTTGTVLNSEPGDLAGNDQNIAGLTSAQSTHKLSYEQNLQKKVQDQLDSILGPGKSKVTVNTEFDFSQVKKTAETYGQPTKEGDGVTVSKKVKTETYNGEEDGSTQQTAFKGRTGSKGDDQKYKSEDITENIKVDKRTVETVDMAPRLKRVSCGVAVDSLKDDQVAKIEGLVKETIGFDASRGDSVKVESMPFAYVTDDTVNLMRQEMASRPQASGAPGLKGLTPAVWAVAALPMVLLMIIVGVFLVKQRNVQSDRSRLVMASGPGATVNDISDLLTDKVGKTQAPAATKVNTTDQLEKLAKEKPTKVAELLKSTWLSEKDR